MGSGVHTSPVSKGPGGAGCPGQDCSLWSRQDLGARSLESAVL